MRVWRFVSFCLFAAKVGVKSGRVLQIRVYVASSVNTMEVVRLGYGVNGLMRLMAWRVSWRVVLWKARDSKMALCRACLKRRPSRKHKWLWLELPQHRTTEVPVLKGSWCWNLACCAAHPCFFQTFAKQSPLHKVLGSSKNQSNLLKKKGGVLWAAWP